MKRAGITLQALVLVGAAFDTDIRRIEAAGEAASSHLYSSDYTHLYRRAVEFSKSDAVHQAKSEAVHQGSGDG